MRRPVLIATASEFLRQGLDYLETTGRYEIVARARSAAEIPLLAEKYRPQLSLIHLDLGDLTSALECCQNHKVILLEGTTPPPAGYLVVPKTSSVAALMRAMDSAFAAQLEDQ